MFFRVDDRFQVHALRRCMLVWSLAMLLVLTLGLDAPAANQGRRHSVKKAVPAARKTARGGKKTPKVTPKKPAKAPSRPETRILVTFAATPKNTFVLRGKSKIPAAKAGWLRQGDVVIGGTGNTDIRLGEQGTFRLKPGTKIRLKTLQRVSKRDPNTVDNRFQIESGTFLARLKALRGQSRFIVDTPSVTTAARGTAFVLQVNSAKSRLLVGEGLMAAAASKNAAALAALANETPSTGVVNVAAGQKIEVATDLPLAVPLAAQPLSSGEQKQTGELEQLKVEESAHPTAELQFWPSSTNRVAYSRNGRIMAAGGPDGRVAFRDGETGAIWHSQGRHKGPVTDIAFAPKGSLIASGGDLEQTVRLWDRNTGEAVTALRGHNAFVKCMVFSTDAKTLIVGGENRISVFDVRGEKLKDSWQVARGVRALALSPDEKILAIGEETGFIEFWDWQNHEILDAKQPFSSELENLAFSSKNVLAASDFSSISLFDGATFQFLRRLPENRLHQTSLAFSPDGQTLYAGGHQGPIGVFDVATGQKMRQLEYQSRVSTFALSPDGQQLLIGDVGGGPVQTWNTASGQKLLTLPEIRYFWTPQPFLTRDKRYYVMADDSGQLRIWDLSTGEVIARLQIPGEAIGQTAFLPQQQMVISAAWSGLRFWKPDSDGNWRIVASDGRHSDCLAVAPDGSWAATTHWNDGLIYVYDPATGRKIREFAAFAPGEDGTAMMVVSPDGKRMAGIGDNQHFVRIFDTVNWREERRLEGLNDVPRCIAYSPNGSTVAAATYKQICLWDVNTGNLKQQLKRDEEDGYFYLDFSPDGKHLAASIRRMVRIWNLETGESEREIVAADCPDQQFASYIGGGKRLLTGGGDESPGQLMIWDALTGARLATLYGLNRAINGTPGTQDVAPANPAPPSWLAVTSEGYFDGSPDSPSWLRWRLGYDLLPSEDYARAMRRPDKVRAALGFEESK